MNLKFKELYYLSDKILATKHDPNDKYLLWSTFNNN